jgi:hypothetical protein
LSRETNIPVIRPRNNITANTMPRIAGSDRAALDADVADVGVGVRVDDETNEFVGEGPEVKLVKAVSVGVGEAR